MEVVLVISGFYAEPRRNTETTEEAKARQDLTRGNIINAAFQARPRCRGLAICLRRHFRALPAFGLYPKSRRLGVSLFRRWSRAFLSQGLSRVPKGLPPDALAVP